MTPTIVLEDGKLRFVLGSPGGARIITTVANIFLSASEGGLNIQQAVDAARFHHQYQPDKLYLEPGFSAETVAALQARGYGGAWRMISEHHWSRPGSASRSTRRLVSYWADRTTAVITGKLQVIDSQDVFAIPMAFRKIFSTKILRMAGQPGRKCRHPKML